MYCAGGCKTVQAEVGMTTDDLGWGRCQKVPGQLVMRWSISTTSGKKPLSGVVLELSATVNTGMAALYMNGGATALTCSICQKLQ